MRLSESYLRAPQKFALVAGEPSGDLLGSNLIRHLKTIYPEAAFIGIGGPSMIEAGLESLYPMERLSVMGLIEPLKRGFELLKLRRLLKLEFSNNPPDVFIGVDAPRFQFEL
jgi:lipid-A-disaccharide synthase